jgi:Tol biopolymer transport system component
MFGLAVRGARSGRTLRQVIVCSLLSTVVALVYVAPAAAKPPPAPNGQISFGNPDGVITTVNPDGSHPNALMRADCARWSPNGSLISTCGGPDPGGSTLLLDPLTGTILNELFPPDPSLFLACYVWSPDGTRLACEHFLTPADPSLTGLYTISASTGGDIRLVNSLPGLQFCLGDYSPDGTQIVFEGMDPTRPARTNTALFVANVDGSRLRQITPWEFPQSQDCTGSWSPNGNWILFDNHQGKLFVVRPDGSGMHAIPLAGAGSRPFAFQPSWSPDGTKFVFALVTGVGTPAGGPLSNAEEGIYTANADGSDVQPVSIAPSGSCCDDGPDWGTHALAGP